MGRNRSRGAVVLSALIATCVCTGRVDALAQIATVCPIDLAGIWKPEAPTDANPIFLSFSADGWVSLLASTEGARAQDFEVMTQVRYRVVRDAGSPSTRIEFTARRGDDVFPPGTSTWDVAWYDDSSFTTVNRESGEQSRWVRVETHRYFLTFAGRSAVGGGSTLAMWTKVDGRRLELEALGLTTTDRGIAAFGRVPAKLANSFTTEPRDRSSAMMRLELTEAEYQRTQRVLEIWKQRLADARRSGADPYALLMEFLGDTARSLNQCGTKINLGNAGALVSDAAVAGGQRLQQPIEFIRLIRALNDMQHVTDDRFPFQWEPPPAR
jgi:hypothetical protein